MLSLQNSLSQLLSFCGLSNYSGQNEIALTEIVEAALNKYPAFKDAISKSLSDFFLSCLNGGGNHVEELRGDIYFSWNLKPFYYTKTLDNKNAKDVFILKDAKAFLQEKFRLWSYQEFWNGKSIAAEEFQALRDIAYTVIDYIDQLNSKLVDSWNAPRHVKFINYVITIDKIPIELIEKIKSHVNYSDQVQEWQSLGIDSNSPKAPIDTKYFKDLEPEILGQFNNLDDSLDGWLIKSENYQAMNTIMPMFKGKVQTIYIDPPFNTHNELYYLYSTKFQTAAWLSLLYDRLRLAKKLLKDTGNIFVRCDQKGNMLLRMLMNEIFGKKNFRNELVVSKVKGVISYASRRFNPAVYSLFFYAMSNQSVFNEIYIKRKKPKKSCWHRATYPYHGKNPAKPRYIFGAWIQPENKRQIGFGQEKLAEMEKEGRFRLKCKCGYIHTSGVWKGCPECGEEGNISLQYLVLPSNTTSVDANWTDIPGHNFTWRFNTENSEALLKRVIECSSNKGDLVMDFFLGSGTTAAVAHKLGRRWIGIEMGDHLYTIVLPRMKKVLDYDKKGISEEVKEYRGGGFFAYCELDQFED